MLHTYLMMKDEKKCKIYGLFQLYFSKAVEPQKWYCGQSEEMIAIHHSIVKNQKKKKSTTRLFHSTHFVFLLLQIHEQSHFIAEFSSTETE